MSITPFLRNQWFDPELIESMSAALAQACRQLDLPRQGDTHLVARHIIEAAQRGVRTKTALYLIAIHQFNTGRW